MVVAALIVVEEDAGFRRWILGNSYKNEVIFVSLPLIKFVFAFTLAAFIGNVLLSIEVGVAGAFEASSRARLLCAIPEGLLLAAVLCPFAIRYVRDREALINQIKTFEMDNTKCTVRHEEHIFPL
ncbi:hypothetical protein Pmar_PMAR024557 [Perkinsus marinus ATCC 50983]|uniref:Uncharacterized protein n=1 Tax=Perkinsus marinus (strain ATCC 50983 / TXsc) TaxID=423536 RepID=C5LTB2_PERM5|nr:hypothetical protein Pmar_PMAR024557 [Perkinsus marinus ATCC 50983]EER00080.1 hypothetical protein Pmar_PMAR024557 [Perkinsus marinus ATCC 50983]|eukprot:XP_002767362.1 hypothetical protein Pmar_PMAR024557 [Perkinsus marinus ATCC 50983]